MEHLLFSRALPEKYRADVCVVGGGAAGIAAAVAAARQGVKVLLIEAQYCFGGLQTAGLAPLRLGNRAPEGALQQEIQERLRAYEAKFSALLPECLKRVYEDMLADAGVQYVLGVQLVDAVVRNHKIQFCVLAGKSGLYTAQADVYIDGTGDGSLAVCAGAPFTLGDGTGSALPVSLYGLWAGVDFTRAGAFHGPKTEWVSLAPSVVSGNSGAIPCEDITDERALTVALIQGRRGFDKCMNPSASAEKRSSSHLLAASASLMCARESRRIVGEYCLTQTDFQRHTVFDDAIAWCCETGEAGQAAEESQGCSVPYRILLPQGTSNLLAAGRCVSTDRFMHAIMQQTPLCYWTGQAAGMAAAWCSREKSALREANLQSIQRELRPNGVAIPQNKG